MLSAASNLLSGIGWATLHSLWIGGVICACLLIAFRCRSSLSATSRYRLGWYALLLTALLSAFAACHHATIQNFLLESISKNLVYAIDSFSSENRWIGVEYVQSAEQFALFNRINRALSEASYLIGSAWCLGALALATKTGLAWLQLARKAGRSQPIPNAYFAGLDLSDSPAGFEIRAHPSVQSPFVFGFLRPKILIPAAFLRQPDAPQVKSVLLHEIAHVQRRDPIMNLALVAIDSSLFLNPFVSWLVSLLQEERECSCDRMAAESLGDRFAYARALLTLQEACQASEDQIALGINQSSLARRVERLCGSKRPHLVRIRKKTSFLSLLVLGACSCSGFLTVQSGLDTGFREKVDLQKVRASILAAYSLDGHARDLSGNNQHGVVKGCSPVPDRHGIPGKALLLDGKTDIVKIPNCRNIEDKATFTTTCWIKPDEGENKWMSWLAKSNLNNKSSQWRIGFGSNNNEWGLTQLTHSEKGDGSNALYALWSRDCDISNQWTHMTAVVNSHAGWVKLYVNGELSGKIDHVKPFIADDSPLYIGYQRDNKHYFKGAIDDVTIYDATLTDSEVMAVYVDERKK